MVKYEDLADELYQQIQLTGWPLPEREYRFHEKIGWRLDLAWPAHKIGFECEGGIWTQGRHTRGQGFIKDCIKYNTAALMGWTIYRVPGPWIVDRKGQIDGRALDWVEKALQQGGLIE